MRSKPKNISLLVLVLLCVVFFSSYFGFINISRNPIHSFDNYQKPHSSSDHDPEIEWFQTWDNGDWDHGYDLAIDSSDNTIVVGDTDLGGVGNNGAVMVKYNRQGDQIWNITWGFNNYDRAFGVTIDGLDNLYVVGRTGGTVDNYNIFLSKFNSSGQHEWSRSWGYNLNDYGYDIALDSDSNIYLVGLTNTQYSADICLIKYDSDGNYQWNKTFGDPVYFDVGYGICIPEGTNDIYITGQTGILDDSDGDICLIKYNTSGIEMWNQTWGLFNKDVGYEIRNSADNFLYISGEYDNNYAILMKYNYSGNLEWYRTWGLGSPYVDKARGIYIDANNHIYTTGCHGRHTCDDLFILKYNSTGDILWEKIWDFLPVGEKIVLDSHLNMYVTGSYAEDLFLLKFEQYSPGDISLTHNADELDTDGKFYLTWNESRRGLSYSVYQHDEPILNEDDLTLVAENLTNNSLYISNLDSGTWYFVVKAFNLIGNSSSNIVNISVVLPPVIMINSPYEGQIFGKDAPNFNITVLGLFINTTWYSLDYGITNTTFQGNGTIDQGLWNSRSNGTITLRFYANNTLGNESLNEIHIKKDIFSPNITIISPIGGTLLGIHPPNFIVYINDTNLDTMWYSLNGGINITFTTNSSFDTTEWSGLLNGTINITFYANDSAGNLGMENINLFIDTLQPLIQIDSPYPEQLFGKNAPSFIVRINDSNLASMWYSFEGGNNITFTVNDTFNLIEWNNLLNGSVTFTFFANDTAGNLAFETMVVRRDIEKPLVSIHNPILNSQFGSISPAYNISIYEGNLDTMWYTLDDGLRNVTISSFVGVIHQLEWTSLLEGHVTIKFFANDTVGNFGYEEVIIIKEINVEPAIPGFNITTIFFLFFVISLIIVYLRKKKDIGKGENRKWERIKL